MAPSSGVGIRVGWQWIAAAFIAIVAIWWIWSVNAAPPRPANVVTITATQPPQQQPPIAAGVSSPLAALPQAVGGPPPCPSVEVTYRWLTVCGAVTMDSQYVYLYRGYIYAPGNLTAFRLAGDTSSCVFSVMSNTLYVNCTSMIAVARAR